MAPQAHSVATRDERWGLSNPITSQTLGFKKGFTKPQKEAGLKQFAYS